MVQLLLYYVVCTAVASASLGGHLLYSIYATILYEYARGVTETAQSRNRMRRNAFTESNLTFLSPHPCIHTLATEARGRSRAAHGAFYSTISHPVVVDRSIQQ